MKSATKPTIPTLQPHHGYESWSSTWRDSAGKQHMKRFGREGKVTRRQALQLYQEWLANEWSQKEHVRNPSVADGVYTVGLREPKLKIGRLRPNLCDDYLSHSSHYYRKDGKSTSHLSQVVVAMELLRASCGKLPVNDISAQVVTSLLKTMIVGKAGNPLARHTVNDRLKIIKQAFAWSHANNGNVSATTAWSISSVAPLKAFRTEAKERKAILPVADATVDATLPHCSSIIADMIQLQRLTGMRPQEVCLMRGDCLEKVGPVVSYKPYRHKTQHHGKIREIFLGPKAMEIIDFGFISLIVAGYLFSPVDAIAEWHTKSGQPIPATKIGDHYTVASYRQAIEKACRRAFPFPGTRLPKELRKLDKTELAEYRKAKADWDKSHAWHPNQLRHAWATKMRQRFGIEAAQIGLGHSDLRTTEIYAQRDRNKAIEAAKEAG